MAARTLEARFERMSVNDENDVGDASKYGKKVSTPNARPVPGHHWSRF